MSGGVDAQVIPPLQGIDMTNMDPRSSPPGRPYQPTRDKTMHTILGIVLAFAIAAAAWWAINNYQNTSILPPQTTGQTTRDAPVTPPTTPLRP